MWLIERVRYGDVNWLPLVFALLLSAVGITFVFSTCYDPESSWGWSREALMQCIWLGISLTACAVCLHVPLIALRRLAIPVYCLLIGVLVLMALAAGSALVPRINGQCNWIDLGPVNFQPSEFMKIATLLACARLLSLPDADAARLRWLGAVLVVGGVPMLLVAREDLGSGLTFVPMLLGLVVIAGIRLRMLVLLLGSGAGAAVAGMFYLANRGADSYLWRRLLAWIDPEAYALREGYQAIRVLRSLGSGRWLGKGYRLGDQNILDWVPEKHTDMVFAIIGEETGFVGATLVVLLFLAFGWACLAASIGCRDRFGRFFIGGFACLVMGQAAINLAVVTQLMPVTGITLPFISYGGSSLLGLFVGVGLCLGLSAARNRQLRVTRYDLG